MLSFIDLLISTILFRPYVFAFLAVYLVAAGLCVGLRKTVSFTLVAWAIAYASEFSSIRNGIPFGLYHYIPSTVGRELWVFGVPFMDSLSFTFLAYSGWSLARVYLPGRRRFSKGVIFLGALLFMLLDVVVDPLALRGDRWFLGKIYYYPVEGAYFGVTISNFIGWFVVGLVTLSIWGLIDSGVEDRVKKRRAEFLGPALYYVVLLFNLAMTFRIGEYSLGWAGVFIFTPLTALLVMRGR